MILTNEQITRYDWYVPDNDILDRIAQYERDQEDERRTRAALIQKLGAERLLEGYFGVIAASFPGDVPDGYSTKATWVKQRAFYKPNLRIKAGKKIRAEMDVIKPACQADFCASFGGIHPSQDMGPQGGFLMRGAVYTRLGGTLFFGWPTGIDTKNCTKNLSALTPVPLSQIFAVAEVQQ